ncbi:MAG: LysM peptidoglycan-binding domain-containing protein [Firmicutes bacterium]|nr:LysM peptidoglycan-binding domain-containing protein [Bacillota bacterium]
MCRKRILFGWLVLFTVSGTVPAIAQTYQVAPGDTLYLIAQRYGTTVEDLKRKNGLNSDLIYPGDILDLGSSQPTHRVAPGESLYLIARRYGTTVEELKAVNGLQDDYLEAGWELALPTSAGMTHEVRAGESLFLIAQRYGTTVEALRAANALKDDIIYPGQTLTVPSGGASPTNGQSYTVRAGDTLYLIALRYGTTVAALREANGLYTDTIYPGQRLVIPRPEKTKKNGSSPSFYLTPEEEDLLARLVSAEAAGEPYAGQVAVAASVLNRLRDPKFPKTITEIIYQYTDGAFQYSPVMDGRINEPATDTAKAAVRDALNGWDPSYGATGFYNPAKTTNPWVQAQPVTTVIGNHVFFKY